MINDFAYKVIRERKSEDFSEKKDLLSRFMNMRDAAGNEFSDTYLRDIVINFM